jgi:hypothetical protein
MKGGQARGGRLPWEQSNLGRGVRWIITIKYSYKMRKVLEYSPTVVDKSSRSGLSKNSRLTKKIN